MTLKIERLLYKLSLYFETHSIAKESQIVFYLPGIGSKTSGLPIINGLFASQLPLDVEKTYINICTNYKWSASENERDKIYIFGFSRGAVVARLVAALIGKYGLLRSSQIEMFPIIWDDFVNERKIQDLDRFKEDYCWWNNDISIDNSNINIEFMGLFDTVYGNYQGKNTSGLRNIFFTDRILGSHIQATTHILALNEARAFFKPVLFKKRSKPDQILEQIWMPGVHADIGGGYPDDLFSKISLMTMLDRVRDHTFLKVDYNRSVDLKNSIEDDLGQNRIIINNEYESFLWKLTALFSKGDRIVNNKDDCQLIHPIYKALEGHLFRNKQKETLDVFNIPKFPFSKYAVVASLDHLKDKAI
jgi:hypothetical protein